MTMVVLAGLLTCGILSNSRWQAVGLWFIAAQSVLSYFSSGVAKLVSPVWRSGDAIVGILRTETFGNPKLATFLKDRPAAAKSLCWLTILFECCFPIVLVVPSPYPWFIVAAGLGFHVGVALVMDLNAFVWAFLATYPAILFCHGHLPHLR